MVPQATAVFPILQASIFDLGTQALTIGSHNEVLVLQAMSRGQDGQVKVPEQSSLVTPQRVKLPAAVLTEQPLLAFKVGVQTPVLTQYLLFLHSYPFSQEQVTCCPQFSSK